MDPRPIGVFDSGVGGLTVVARILDRLPHERVVYFGDTARLPYGSKSAETVTRFSREITRFLLRQDVKAIVVACNSASAMALPAIAPRLDVLTVGVIEPGADAAVKHTKTGTVGVIGTSATVRSGAYRDALRSRRPDVDVRQVATPLFVHLVEEGWVAGDVPRRVARHYLAELAESDADTVILGCTHYPLLRPIIAGEVAGATLVDSADETASELARQLEARDLLAAPEQNGALVCYASDVTEGFARLGEPFLGRKLPPVQLVEQSDLPWYDR